MLTVRQLKKKIEGQTVLENISFTLEKGTITALLGRNGVGKTTLLRTIIGILTPDEGTVMYDAIDLYQQPSMKQKIVYVPDSTNYITAALTGVVISLIMKRLMKTKLAWGQK